MQGFRRIGHSAALRGLLRWALAAVTAVALPAAAQTWDPTETAGNPVLSEAAGGTDGWATTTREQPSKRTAEPGKPIAAKDLRDSVRAPAPSGAASGVIDLMAQAPDMPAAEIPPGPADEPMTGSEPAAGAAPAGEAEARPAPSPNLPPDPATALPPDEPAKAAQPQADTNQGTSPPAAVPTEAQPAAPSAEAATAPPPVPVTLGIYINDIQDLDFRTNSYVVDLYMWFRWRSKDVDPVKSVEFMNIFDPEGAVKTVLLDEAREMPDGSFYNIVRYHGRFSKKFRLEKYPFDRQQLDFIIEDSVSPQTLQLFVADTRGISMNPSMTLPGFRFGTPQMEISGYTYPTDFGDLSAAAAETYSRAVVSVPITRPMFTLAIKTFGPILLIVICATLVFYINPHFVEGRIGLAITALLTLVALQFTAAANLPDADYFTMLDKLYMLSYGFIIASLLRVVVTSWQTVEGSIQDRAVARGDHRWGYVLLTLYGIAAALVAGWVLAR